MDPGLACSQLVYIVSVHTKQWHGQCGACLQLVLKAGILWSRFQC